MTTRRRDDNDDENEGEISARTPYLIARGRKMIRNLFIDFVDVLFLVRLARHVFCP
jgi:hypothetical protein